MGRGFGVNKKTARNDPAVGQGTWGKIPCWSSLRQRHHYQHHITLCFELTIGARNQNSSRVAKRSGRSFLVDLMQHLDSAGRHVCRQNEKKMPLALRATVGLTEVEGIVAESEDRGEKILPTLAPCHEARSVRHLTNQQVIVAVFCAVSSFLLMLNIDGTNHADLYNGPHNSDSMVGYKKLRKNYGKHHTKSASTSP